MCPKLDIGSRPIANKYHEGKVKMTFKRESKVPEIAAREATGTSVSWQDWCVYYILTNMICFNLKVTFENPP